MKKHYLLLFGLLITNLTFCQDYYPFPDSNAIWNNRSYWSPYKWINRYGIYGDTIINNQHYKKIYQIEDDSTLNINNMTYYAGIRENDSKQIFVKFEEYEFEFLIYDFSLSVGDTVITNAPDGYLNWLPCVITGIDTIELENNQYRRRFKINDWGEYEYWIEGIGSIGGLFYPVLDYLSGTINNLLCFKHNDTAVYIDNPDCDKCFCSLATSTEEITERINKIIIYPIPATTKLIIDSKLNTGVSTIKLFNSSGLLIESRIIKTFPLQLSIEELPNGIYTIQLTNGELTFSKKFIKTE